MGTGYTKTGARCRRCDGRGDGCVCTGRPRASGTGAAPSSIDAAVAADAAPTTATWDPSYSDANIAMFTRHGVPADYANAFVGKVTSPNQILDVHADGFPHELFEAYPTDLVLQASYWHRHGVTPEGAQAYLDAGVPKIATNMSIHCGLTPERAATICATGAEYFEGHPSNWISQFADADDPAAAIRAYAKDYVDNFGKDTKLPDDEIAGIRQALIDYRDAGGRVWVDTPSDTFRQLGADGLVVTIYAAATDRPVLATNSIDSERLVESLRYGAETMRRAAAQST